MSTKVVASVIGVVLIITGVIGFIPNPIAYSENAIFTVNAAHNVVHIVSGDMILGFISNNGGDNWLHVVLALVLLAAGFGMADREMSPAM